LVVQFSPSCPNSLFLNHKPQTPNHKPLKVPSWFNSLLLSLATGYWLLATLFFLPWLPATSFFRLPSTRYPLPATIFHFPLDMGSSGDILAPRLWNWMPKKGERALELGIGALEKE
jgi:hypothetical protein